MYYSKFLGNGGGEYKTHLFPQEEELAQAVREITEFSKK